MKYVLTILLLAVLIYILSFARYNWIKKNKLAAVGTAFIAITAVGFSLFVVFFSGFEI